MGSLPLERSINHYTNFHQILLVGEGDFSFSLALATAFGSAENMVPTSLDSEGRVIQLYKSARKTLSKLKKLGAMVLHGVDARTMEKHHIIIKTRFHRIVFNFPHAGFYGEESDEKVIKKHCKLSKLFFWNARTMLSEIGEIHVSHKESDPYKKWELVKQAEECGLLLKESVHFTKEDYPGYTNRKGAGSNAGQTFCLGDCRTYKFVLGPELLYKQKLMAIRVVLSNVSSKDSAEKFGTAILKPGSKRQPKGKMRKADSETLFNGLEMLLNEEINTSDEFARQMTDTLRQMAEAWSVKTEFAKKLNEAYAVIDRFGTSLVDSIPALESERQARKVAEREKVDLEKSLNQLRVNLNKELDKNDELKKQRDEAFLQREEACRVKSKIVEESNLELESARRARKVATKNRDYGGVTCGGFLFVLCSLFIVKGVLGK